MGGRWADGAAGRAARRTVGLVRAATGFRARQAVTTALVANAVHPPPGFRPGVVAFGIGGLVGELAPHVLGLTTAEVVTHLVHRRRREPDRVGLALAAVSTAGLLVLLEQSRRARVRVEDALVAGLGADYLEELDEVPRPADLAVRWRSLVNPFRPRPVGVVAHKDISYGPAGRRNLLDVYAPADPDLRPPGGSPVLLQVHGGGWSLGDKDHQGIPLMHHMAARGWVCVVPNYRLSPRSAMPDHVVDVKRALAWTRANIARWGGDPSYVAITGGSAGGHLAALVALTPGDPELQPGFEDADTSVQAAVPHYGVYDFAGASGLRSARLMRDTFLAPRVVQRRFADDPGIFERLSPLLRVTPDAPDFFVLHGSSDSLVDVRQSRLLVERLREVSRRTVVYAELPGAQHAFDVLPSIRSSHVVMALDRYLHWHWTAWRRGAAADAGS